MPELRKDPIVDRWVIISPGRVNRPHEFKFKIDRSVRDVDPFAEGNESATPPEIAAYRNADSKPNEPGWRVRVIANRYPALVDADTDISNAHGPSEQHPAGLYEMLPGVGAHEVIVECPQSESNMSRLSIPNIREVLSIYRERLLCLGKDSQLAHALIFKNQGAMAGASLEHSHSQLIATPIVPSALRAELIAAEKLLKSRGQCAYEDVIQHELKAGSRIVLETANFVAFCPYASRFPFETWILPKRHSSHYEHILPQEIDDLGMVLKNVLAKLELAQGDPPFNYLIQTAPFSQDQLPHFRWRIEILPRLTGIAGFELGSGTYINPVPPEDAAETLRTTRIETTV